MASPAVAGAAALYWSSGSYTLAQLRTNLRNSAVSGLITGVPTGTPNLFIRTPCP